MQDLSAPDADEHVRPALQAAELAVAMLTPQDVPITLVPFDLAEDPSASEEIASDPSFVAAIVGPGADGRSVAETGIPTVSVSTAGSTPDGGSWRRFVAPIGVLADSIAAELEGSDPCILSEEPPPDALGELLGDRLGGPATSLDPASAPAFVQASGCDAVAWAGSPDAGAELAQGLPPGVALVGGDRLLDPDFLGAGPAGDGARAVCACTDLSASIDPEVMRFIQDYQSEFGTAPGPYAVESWDATRALLGGLAGGATREEVSAVLADLERVAGLGTTYRFEPTGELADTTDALTVSELRYGRWRSPPSG